MKRILTVLALLVVPLVGLAQCPPSLGARYGVGVSPDVCALCNQALQRTVVYSVPTPPPVTETVTYSAPLPAVTQPSYATTTTYTEMASLPLTAVPCPTFGLVRAFPSYSYGFNGLSGYSGYGTSFGLRSFATGGYGGSPIIQINNEHRGFGYNNTVGFNGGFSTQPPVQINNIDNRRGGGGGLGGAFAGLGAGIGSVIGAVSDAANTPAGLFTIGALAGGGFGRGGGGGGAQSFFNFAAAQNAGLNPSAAAAFSASQQPKSGGLFGGLLTRKGAPIPVARPAGGVRSVGVRVGVGPRLPVRTR